MKSNVNHPAATVRIGPVSAIPNVLAEFGIAPGRVLARAGLRASAFDLPETYIPFDVLGRLLWDCARRSRCDHFGLLVGERFTLSNLGALGHSMRNCPTVGDALHELFVDLHLYDRGAVAVLVDLDSSSALLGYSVRQHATAGVTQIYDAATAIGYRVLQELCGRRWTPQYVQLAHSLHGGRAAYRRLFGGRLRFDGEVSGIVFARTWLDAPIKGADPLLHRLIRTAMQPANAGADTGFAERVRHSMHQMLPKGRYAATDVARAFGIHERTVRKRLAGERTSLHRIVAETRFELSQLLLEHTELPMTEIAAFLRFADPAVFSRAFRRWASVSPSEWRARRRGK
ncbi:MAG TPA: AraC family transcriptional regulator [Steroidobacteraceae bacterium]|nr:AraC family transcriptional regulator [Steroidobacteraceae bacterium]